MSGGIRSPGQAVCLWILSPCPSPCPVSRGHRVDAVVLFAQHPTPSFWMPWLTPLTWFMFSYDLVPNLSSSNYECAPDSSIYDFFPPMFLTLKLVRSQVCFSQITIKSRRYWQPHLPLQGESSLRPEGGRKPGPQRNGTERPAVLEH